MTENRQFLKNILNPVTYEEFIKTYWEKKFVHIERNQLSYFNDILSVDNIDEILDCGNPTGNYIRLVKNQVALEKGRYENDQKLILNQIYAAFADGYSLNVNNINEIWSPLRRVTYELAHQFYSKVTANLYLTPKKGKALLPHHDSHDVIVLQIDGSKKWKLYEPPAERFELPLLGSPQPIYNSEQLGVAKDITLLPGDVLYIPRGTPHLAYTEDEFSLHVTLGVYPFQMVDLFHKYLDSQALNNKNLRKALPLDFFDSPDTYEEEILKLFGQLSQNISDKKNLKTAKAIIKEEFRSSTNPIADGHFRSLVSSETLNSETIVCLRNGVKASLHATETDVRIYFTGNIIKGPISVKTAFSYIINGRDEFKVGDIPTLSPENQIKIAKRLIRGGLLKIVS